MLGRNEVVTGAVAEVRGKGSIPYTVLVSSFNSNQGGVMKVHSKWVSLQTAIRKVSLMDRDRFCLESKRVPYHRVVRGNYGDIQVFALVGADPVLTYLIAFDFEVDSLYRVIEDPDVIAKCLKK